VDEAIRWLREKREAYKPFFLFVCFHEPHEPIATDPRFARQYDSPDDPTLAAHHGNISQMDHAFGRLMDALDDQGLRESTLVFFTSDNGPAITNRNPHGSAGPLRDKKGSLYEGGIRVPGIFRWPGRIAAGTTSDQPLSGVDVLPTLCELANVRIRRDRKIDGTSVLPIFDGMTLLRETALYWQFNRARSEPKVAMRIGRWKILARLSGPEPKRGADLVETEMQAMKNAELTGFELYDLEEDIGETDNLASEHPRQLAAMATELKKMYREVRDETPVWPAWEWPRYESQRIIWPLPPPGQE
jgi:arylsulfatase A